MFSTLTWFLTLITSWVPLKSMQVTNSTTTKQFHVTLSHIFANFLENIRRQHYHRASRAQCSLPCSSHLYTTRSRMGIYYFRERKSGACLCVWCRNRFESLRGVSVELNLQREKEVLVLLDLLDLGFSKGII